MSQATLAIIVLPAVAFLWVMILISAGYMLVASSETRREWLRGVGVGAYFTVIAVGAVIARGWL